MLFQMPKLNLTPPISSTSFQRPYMCYMVESRLKDRDTIYVLESPIEKIRSWRDSWYTLLTTSSSHLMISSDVKAGEIDLPFPLSNYVFRRICVLWLHWLLALGLPIGCIFPLSYMCCHAVYVCHTCVMCIHIHMWCHAVCWLLVHLGDALCLVFDDGVTPFSLDGSTLHPYQTLPKHYKSTYSEAGRWWWWRWQECWSILRTWSHICSLVYSFSPTSHSHIQPASLRSWQWWCWWFRWHSGSLHRG